jgi:Holliday junction resolvase RusA-like endonuclease
MGRVKVRKKKVSPPPPKPIIPRVEFNVWGEIVGKQRARITSMGSYTPQKTVDKESEVRRSFLEKYWDTLARQYVLFQYCFPKGVPIRISITCFQAKKDYVSGEMNIKKPDLDNIVKLVCDALNKVLWNDDAQIVHIVARKFYRHDPGDENVLVEPSYMRIVVEEAKIEQ